MHGKWLLSSDHWDLLNGRPKHNRVFTGVEKTIIEDRYKNDQLNDKKSREDVETLTSGDGKPLSTEEVRIWVDNFKVSLKKQKDKQSEGNDKE